LLITIKSIPRFAQSAVIFAEKVIEGFFFRSRKEVSHFESVLTLFNKNKIKKFSRTITNKAIAGRLLIKKFGFFGIVGIDYKIKNE